MADYNIRRLDDKGWVEFDVHAPSLDTAIDKFKELEDELSPETKLFREAGDAHAGEQTLFESEGLPDPFERDAEARAESQLD